MKNTEEINSEELDNQNNDSKSHAETDKLNTPLDEVKVEVPKKKKSIFKGNKEQELKELLNEEKAKNSELNDKFLRLYSEFDNFRKRTIKEKSDLYKTAAEDVISSLLSINDDFERALKAIGTDEENKVHREGMELIYNKFSTVLKQKGVEEIQALGNDFNTDLHEALTKIPSPTPDLKGKVVDVLEKGYKLNGKVIRFAKVVIGD